MRVKQASAIEDRVAILDQRSLSAETRTLTAYLPMTATSGGQLFSTASIGQARPPDVGRARQGRT